MFSSSVLHPFLIPTSYPFADGAPWSSAPPQGYPVSKQNVFFHMYMLSSAQAYPVSKVLLEKEASRFAQDHGLGPQPRHHLRRRRPRRGAGQKGRRERSSISLLSGDEAIEVPRSSHDILLVYDSYVCVLLILRIMLRRPGSVQRAENHRDEHRLCGAGSHRRPLPRRDIPR